jgi:diacylglycerol kinase family enzyme
VTGSDADLAQALAGAGPTPLVCFVPSPGSDLARALGLGGSHPGSVALPMDALRLKGTGLAVNSVVIGAAPDQLRPWHRRHPAEVEVDGRRVFSGRATTVVVMNGQYLRAADLAPRGHPGDGACEIQVYSLPPSQRRPMRARLASGSHLPHPTVTTARGRRVTVRLARASPLELDGRAAGRADALDVEVVAGAYRLLV